MNKPHKHAEMIKAWADGAEIECRSDASDSWDFVKNPNWITSLEYRIKPEEKKPVVRWLWAKRDGLVTAHLLTEAEVQESFGKNYPIKLEWSRTEFPE